jgi:hypothetical protein
MRTLDCACPHYSSVGSEDQLSVEHTGNAGSTESLFHLLGLCD